MDRLVLGKRIRILLAIHSFLLFALSVCGIILFSARLLYIPLAAATVIAICTSYMTPLYLFSYSDFKVAIKIFTIVNGEEICTVSSVSERVGINERTVRKITVKFIHKGYLAALSLDGESIIKN